MKNTKVLEMLLAGRIEELKAELRDEIYADALKSKPGAKKRYNAMKRYFKYNDSVREYCQKPCIIDYEGKPYASFCNSFSLALTTEPCGTLELFTDTDRYPNISRLVNREGDEKKLNLIPALAEAHSKGYKLKKNEVLGKPGYLFHYNNAYFKAGLFSLTYDIIDNGGEVTVYHAGKHRPITIENDIGICVIMPMRLEEVDDNIVVIELDK